MPIGVRERSASENGRLEGMEGPGRLRRNVGDACSDAWSPPLGTFHIGDDSATAPNF